MIFNMIVQATQNILTKTKLTLNANYFDGIKLLFIKEKLNDFKKKVDPLKQTKLKSKHN